MVNLPFIDFKTACTYLAHINPLKAELNSICYLLAILGGATIVVVNRLRVKLFRPKLLTRNTKLELYQAPVRPNRSEAWATATEEMYVLRVFERKIVWKI